MNMITKEYYIPTKGSKKHAAGRWILDHALFFLKGKLKEKPKDILINKINKILIIDNGHIGDVVMSTSIFREIKKAYPNIIIDVLTTSLTKPLLDKNPYINKIITSELFWRKETRNWHTLRKYFSLIRQLRKEEYDMGIAVRSDLPNILTMWFSKIPNRVAYYNLDGGKPFLTHPIKYAGIPTEYGEIKDMHAMEADSRLIAEALPLHLNWEGIDETPEIFVDKQDVAYTDCFFACLNVGHYICIVPGACAKLQTWNRENYRAIIKWIKKEYPAHYIILAGGKDDEELINYLSLNSDKCIKLIDYNLRHLGTVFDNADAVLLQDGGPMHIAYTMMKDADRKLFILWGPNPLDHVAPLKGKLIHHKLDCYPCMRREDKCKRSEGQRCMDLISVEEVKKEIEKCLKN